MVAVVILVLFVLGFFLTLPVITLLHECGHAFAHLILSDCSRIDVYIGSYRKRSELDFRIGKLHFHVKFGTLGHGCCKAFPFEKNYVKEIIILLAGPVFCTAVVLVSSIFIFRSGVHGAIKLYFFILIFLTIVSLFRNLLPDQTKTDLDSDGQQIYFAFKLKKNYAIYIEAIEAYQNKQFEVTAEKLDFISTLVPYNAKILRILIDSLWRTSELDKAAAYLTKLKDITTITREELLLYANALAIAGHYDESIPVYKELLGLDAHNLIALNNLGYAYALTCKLEQAALTIGKVLELDDKFASAYSISGLIKLQLGDLENGKLLIEKSLEMDPDYSYSYKHLAIYYQKNGDNEKALINLKKANEMNRFISLDSLSLA